MHTQGKQSRLSHRLLIYTLYFHSFPQQWTIILHAELLQSAGQPRLNFLYRKNRISAEDRETDSFVSRETNCSDTRAL